MTRGFRLLGTVCAGLALSAAAAWAGPRANPREAAINGVWQLQGPAITQLKDVNGKAPPLNAAGAKLHAERQALMKRGDTSFDLTGKCKPMGFPRVLWNGSPFDMQVITDQAVFQGFTFNRNHRLFVAWGEQLPPLQIPRYYGTSSAHWDGNTLVVQSGLYNDNTLLDASGLPLSDEMTLIERYTPARNGRALTVQLTITDARYYSQPWTVSVRFNRIANGRIAEDVCQERSEFYRSLLPATR